MKIFNKIFLIIAPLILLNILFNRLFIFKEAPNLLELSSYQIIIYLYITITLISLFIINLLQKLNIINKNTILHRYRLLIYRKYHEALIKAEPVIYNSLLKYLKIDTRKFISKFVNYVRTSIVLKTNLYFIINMPKLILAIIFALNVILYNNFTYFYYVMPLLLIPLIINYILYRLIEEYQAGFYKIKDLVDVINKTSKNDIKVLDDNNIVLQTEPLNKYILHRAKNIYDDNLVLVLSLKTFKSVSHNRQIDIKATTAKYTKFVDLLIETKAILLNVDLLRIKYDFIINNICYLLYIVGWIHIIILSFPTLDPLVLSNLLSWLPPSSDNPFI